MRRLTLAVGGVLAAVAALATAPAAQAQSTGTIYVVHGIPNTPVDVYVDGQRAIDDFAPGASQGPLDLPSGSHQVALFAADAPDGSGTPVLSGQRRPPGRRKRHPGRAPDASPANRPSPRSSTTCRQAAAGQARLVVRHTAAAPAVDVLAAGTPVISGLTNPNEKALEVPAGTVTAAVAAAGTTRPVIGPADLNLKEGTATFVHAIGSLQDNTLSLVAHDRVELHSAPSGVPSGRPRCAVRGRLPGWLMVSATGRPAASSALSVRRLRGGRAAPDARPAHRRAGRRAGLVVGLRLLVVPAALWLVGTATGRRRGAPLADRGPGAGSRRRRPGRRRGHLRRAPGAACRRSGIRLLQLGVDAPVLPVGVDGRGEMAVPDDVRTVGWYRFGPRPGHGRVERARRPRRRPGSRATVPSTGWSTCSRRGPVLVQLGRRGRAALPGARPSSGWRRPGCRGRRVRPRRPAAADADHLRRRVRPGGRHLRDNVVVHARPA